MIEEKQHSKYSPSGSSRYMICAASVHLQDENSTSAAAEEGTKAHELADILIEALVDYNKDEIKSILYTKNFDKLFKIIEQQFDWSNDSQDIRINKENFKKIKNIFIDKEMVTYVLEYILYLREIPTKTEAFYSLNVETELDLSHIIPGTKGTSDALLLTYHYNNSKSEYTLHVIDLKYGQGVKVDAYKNTQLMMYALGALRQHNFYNITKIKLHIVQPRMNNFDVYETDLEELAEFEERLIKQYELCESDDPPFNPSESACRFCDFKPKCKALLEHTQAVLLPLFDNVESKRIEANNEEIAKLLDNKKLIENYLKSVEEYAIIQATFGEEYPGYELSQTRGRRQYIDEAEGILFENFGNEVYENKLLPITTIEKKFGKKVIGELNLTKLSEGKPVLKKKKE